MSTPLTGLPVLKMCENPVCGGANACDRVRKDRPSMGIAEWHRLLLPDPDSAANHDRTMWIMCQELAISGASTSEGVLHFIPDGCEFTVHRGSAGYLGPDHPGEELWTAVYSGEADRDAILADAPLRTDETAMAARMAAISAARPVAA